LHGPAIKHVSHLRGAKSCELAGWFVGRLRRHSREQRDQSEADRRPMAQ